MSQVAVDASAGRDFWLSAFAAREGRRSGDEPWWLTGLRRSALGRFAALGFPTTRIEDWKYTNLAPLARLVFPDRDGVDSRRPGVFSSPLARLEGRLVTTVGGRPQDPIPQIPGVELRSLKAAWRCFPDLVRARLARAADFERHALVALNTAFFEDGLWLRVPGGVVVEQPIFIIHHTPAAGQPVAAHPRTLVLAGPNSQVSLIEAWTGPDGETYFANAVTEIFAEEGAVLDYTRLQMEGNEAYHFAALHVWQGRAATVTTHSIALGAGLARSEVRAVLAGEGASCELNGLYVVRGRQHVDNYTTIDHARPRATSHELYKGILDEQAEAVFHGRIIVRPEAQKTDAIQRNRNLLLSDDAVANSKPQLEIYADDVRCTHGATAGQVDADAVFYLRSRGLGREQARRLLTLAFAGEMTARIKHPALRALLEQELLRRLNGAEGEMQ